MPPEFDAGISIIQMSSLQAVRECILVTRLLELTNRDCHGLSLFILFVWFEPISRLILADPMTFFIHINVLPVNLLIPAVSMVTDNMVYP